MPTLFRLLIIALFLAGIVYGAMWAIAIFVEPTPREITTPVSPTRLQPR